MLANSPKNVEKKKRYLTQIKGKNYGIYQWTFHKVALLVHWHKFSISTVSKHRVKKSQLAEWQTNLVVYCFGCGIEIFHSERTNFSCLKGRYQFQWVSLKGFHIGLRWQGRKKAADIASVSKTEVRGFTGLCEILCILSKYFHYELLSRCFLLHFFFTYPNFLWFLTLKALNYSCRRFLTFTRVWRCGALA